MGEFVDLSIQVNDYCLVSRCYYISLYFELFCTIVIVPYNFL